MIFLRIIEVFIGCACEVARGRDRQEFFIVLLLRDGLFRVIEVFIACFTEGSMKSNSKRNSATTWTYILVT